MVTSSPRYGRDVAASRRPDGTTIVPAGKHAGWLSMSSLSGCSVPCIAQHVAQVVRSVDAHHTHPCSRSATVL